MLETRHDGLTGRTVLVAPGRSERPRTNAPDPATSSDASSLPSFDPTCPFCPGNESETPPEIARIGDGAPGEPGWRVRVFPNLYPFADVHEVVALSPDHARGFGALRGDEPVEVLQMLRERSRVLAGEGCEHVQALVNQGRAAGASIAHPHAQVVALDFVPPAVSSALEHFARAGTDPVTADADDAFGRGLGVVDDGIVRVWCPWAGRAPYETRIAAARPEARFSDASDDELARVAAALRNTLAGIGRVLDDPPYNVVVHTAPESGDDPYHWWVEIVPRTGVVAGFEMGTGVLVNTLPPEVAAAALRDAAVS